MGCEMMNIDLSLLVAENLNYWKKIEMVARYIPGYMAVAYWKKVK